MHDCPKIIFFAAWIPFHFSFHLTKIIKLDLIHEHLFYRP